MSPLRSFEDLVSVKITKFHCQAIAPCLLALCWFTPTAAPRAARLMKLVHLRTARIPPQAGPRRLPLSATCRVRCQRERLVPFAGNVASSPAATVVMRSNDSEAFILDEPRPAVCISLATPYTEQGDANRLILSHNNNIKFHSMRAMSGTVA